MISRNLYTKQQIAGIELKRKGFFRALFLAGVMLFGVQAMAQNYVQVTNTVGTATNYGITATVTSSGAVGSSTPCGSTASPYFLTGGSGSYTITFSAPVGSVRVPVIFGTGTAGDFHVTRNGLSYTLTAANIISNVSPNCGDGTLATISSGDLVNTGDLAGDPSADLVIPGPITSITLSTTTSAQIVFGVFFTPSSYFQVLNGAGSSVVNGVTVGVTSSGDEQVTTACSNIAAPYVVGNITSSVGQFNYTFTPAVDGIAVPTIFGASGTTTNAHYVVDGSGVSLTSGTNINGIVNPNCGDNTAATIVGGDLSDAADAGGDPSALVMLNGSASTLTVSNPLAGNAVTWGVFITQGSTSAMTFDNSAPTLNVCANAVATSINSQLAVTDQNSNNLTLTWSVVVPPSHGSLGGFPTTSLSTGASVTPAGLTYQPTPAYVGTDAFTVQVSDGVNVASVVLYVTVSPSPDLSSFSTAAANTCQGSGSTVTITSSSLADGTYNVTYNLSGANSGTGLVAILTMSAGTGTFTTTSLANAGGTTIVITNVASACASAVPGSGNVAGFTVNANPGAIFVPGPVCVGSTISVSDVTLTCTCTSSNGAIASVGATVSGTATVTGVAAGTATLTYTNGSCFVTAPVTVNPAPAAITGSTTVCTGTTTPLGETTAGGTWTSSNPAVGSVSSGGVVAGIVAGTMNITYTLPAGCFAVYPMTVNQTPPAITGSTFVVCTGSSIPVADGTSGGIFSSSDGSLASVTGTGGPGSGTANINGVSAGNPTITYTVPSGCFVTQQVTVNTTPNAIAGATSVCVGFSTLLTDLTPGGTWSSSNPTLGSVVASGAGAGTVTGVTAGSPTITYTAANACYVTLPFTVNNNPAAIAGSPFTVCTGSTNLVTDATGGGTWSSSNAGQASITGGGGVITGNSVGVPTISYTLGTGCYAIQSYTVNQTPVPTTGSSQVCVGATTTLTNTTGGGTWSETNGTGSATVGAGTGIVTGVTAGTVNIT